MGAINYAPEGTNLLRAFQGNEQLPLVASASSLLDREAENWLLALAIIETVYYSIQEPISAQRSMRHHAVSGILSKEEGRGLITPSRVIEIFSVNT